MGYCPARRTHGICVLVSRVTEAQLRNIILILLGLDSALQWQVLPLSISSAYVTERQLRIGSSHPA